MTAPEVTYLADTYRFLWEESRVTLLMERIHEARGGDLTAEVEVRCSRDVPNAFLHMAKVNLVSARGQAEVERALSARIPSSQIDWAALLREACYLAVKHWREGDPIVDLRDVPPREGSRFLLDPFIEQAGATILFADGGAGKSLLGLSLATAIAAGCRVIGGKPREALPTLYLDWESDAETHADRRRAICAGASLDEHEAPILYRRQAASLAESAAHTRRVIAEEGIGFVVIDSLGAARGGEPESADSTIRLFNAARSLDVPWLGIDHVTKNGGPGQSRPFGSIYTHNLARLTWGLELIEDHGDGSLLIALTNHKANNGRLLGRRAYEVTVTQDEQGRPVLVRYRDRDARDIPSLFGRLGQAQQIAAVLRQNRQALTVEDIARCLEAEGITLPSNQIRAVLTKPDSGFVQVSGEGRPRWGLRAREDEA